MKSGAAGVMYFEVGLLEERRNVNLNEGKIKRERELSEGKRELEKLRERVKEYVRERECVFSKR